MGRLGQVRPHQEKWCTVLLPEHGKKTIVYPLADTKTTASQCHYIEYPALCSALKDSGIPPNTQRDIVSDPSSLLGLKNRSLYSTQGHKYLMTPMKPGKSDCITGQHLRDSIEYQKLGTGWSGYLFSNNFSPLTKCTPKLWITNKWKFLCKKNMAIE